VIATISLTAASRRLWPSTNTNAGERRTLHGNIPTDPQRDQPSIGRSLCRPRRQHADAPWPTHRRTSPVLNFKRICRLRLSHEYADCDHPNDNETKTSDQHRHQSAKGIGRWSIVTDMKPLIVSFSFEHHTSPYVKDRSSRLPRQFRSRLNLRFSLTLLLLQSRIAIGEAGSRPIRPKPCCVTDAARSRFALKDTLLMYLYLRRPQPKPQRCD